MWYIICHNQMFYKLLGAINTYLAVATILNSLKRWSIIDLDIFNNHIAWYLFLVWKKNLPVEPLLLLSTFCHSLYLYLITLSFSTFLFHFIFFWFLILSIHTRLHCLNASKLHSFIIKKLRGFFFYILFASPVLPTLKQFKTFTFCHFCCVHMTLLLLCLL